MNDEDDKRRRKEIDKSYYYSGLRASSKGGIPSIREVEKMPKSEKDVLKDAKRYKLMLGVSILIVTLAVSLGIVMPMYALFFNGIAIIGFAILMYAIYELLSMR